MQLPVIQKPVRSTTTITKKLPMMKVPLGSTVMQGKGLMNQTMRFAVI